MIVQAPDGRIIGAARLLNEKSRIDAEAPGALNEEPATPKRRGSERKTRGAEAPGL